MSKDPIVVTTSWDDGYNADFKVFKLMKKYDLKGTFYVCINRKNFNRLSNSEIKQISKTQEIGAHTLTHPALTKISLNEVKQEALGSKRELEKILGKKVLSFAYPYGRYNQLVEEVVKKSGFVMARADKPFHFSNRDPFAINVSCDAYQHRFLGNCLLLTQSGQEGLKFLFTEGFANDWVKLAKKTFDFVLRFGGVWHLHGHSYEIERSNLWENLEEVFSYVSHRDVQYCFNKDLVKFVST